MLIIKEKGTFEILNNMLSATKIEPLKKILLSWREKQNIIGFVPTMGAIHSGHVSLLKKAKKDCDRVVCSIFINPTQFNNPNDLKNYPIQIKEDFQKLKDIGCDLVFSPLEKELYPKGAISNAYNLKGLDTIMEGKKRPGHFNGVCTVVQKLFEVIMPNKAYFGEKDYQQLAIIKELTKSLDFNIDIVSCPTIREKDGLAMSSRNTLLSDNQRKVAASIFKIITTAKKIHQKNNPEETKQWVKNAILQITEMKLDYVEIVDAKSLKKTTKKTSSSILCIAVFVGNIRLIDNIFLK